MEKIEEIDFLIVGAAKAGTTSLYYYLDQHPEIFMSPVKEPCFLAYGENKPSFKLSEDTVFNLNQYKNLFSKKLPNQISGEASAIYLYFHKVTIKNINKYFGVKKPKIIIMLRHPVERAYSQYMMNLRDLREELTFEEAVESENKRMDENWNSDFFYMERGFYSDAVKAYLKEFECKIIFFEEFINDRKNILSEVLEFLNLEQSFSFKDEEKFNASGKPKIKWVNNIIKQNSIPKRIIKTVLPRKLRNTLFEKLKNRIYKYNLEKVPINKNTFNELSSYFLNEIEKLETLLNKDLTSWKKRR